MRILRNLLAGLLILWGLLAAALRLAAPLIAEHRAEFEHLVATRLGTPVGIGGIEARWYGISPLLRLEQVTLGDGAQRLHAAALTLELDPSALFSGSLLDALRVTVHGLRLTLARDPDGRLHLEGLGSITDPGHGGDRLPLPRAVHLSGTHLVWVDRKAGKAPLSIDDIGIVMTRDADHLDLRASLQTASGRATLGARIRGRLDSTDWSGDSYLRVEDLGVAQVFAPYLPSDYGLRSLNLDLELWTHWGAATMRHSQGRFAVRDLDLRPHTAGYAPLQLARAAAEFSIDRDDSGGRAGLHGLDLQVGDHPWPQGDLAIAWASTLDGGTRIDAAADYLRIEDLAAILQVRPPWPALQDRLGAHHPRGEVKDLRLQAELGGAAPQWRAQARFAALGSDPVGRIPGLSNLNGQVQAQQDLVRLELDSSGAEVRFADLFRDPIELTRLEGRLDLTHDEVGWRAHSDLLLADTPHISTSTRLDLRTRPGHRPFLDLQTDFHDGDAAFALRYYPVAVMGKGLVDWLDHSIRSGRVISGSALVYGPLEDFAFERTGSGVFQVVFDTDDVVLDYRDGWPPVEHLDAHVRFSGNHLDIDAQSGTIYDSRVVQATAHVASLHPTSPIRVQGRLDGPLANNLRVLGEDALADRFGQFATAFRGHGETRLMLDFTIPLAHQGDYALDGQLHFDAAGLELPDWDFRIDGIQGQLGFDLDGLRAQAIKGRALGAPISVDVAPQRNGATQVRARGHFDVADLARQLPGLPLAFAKGSADFIVDVEVPPARAADHATRLTVDSELRGIGLALPPPIGKTADARRRLQVEIPLGAAGGIGSLRYAGGMAARFDGDGRHVDVALGEDADLPRDPGVRVHGALSEVDADAWLTTLQRLPTPAVGQALPPLSVDLRIAQFSAAPMTLHGLHLVVAQDAGLWRGQVDAHEMAGHFSWETGSDDAPIDVDLDHLTLIVPLDDTTPDAPPPDPMTGPDPATLPGLSLRVGTLTINEARLGTLQLEARHTPQGLEMARLDLRGAGLELDGSGRWVRSADRFVSEIQAEMRSTGIGDLLVDLGYSRQIEEAAGGTGIDLHWPGNPAQLHRATLDGSLTLDIGAGRLVELDPGVTRVVGLLNLNALTRRLRLDFSDFYKKGYSFDRIGGTFRFADARARTDDLRVTGPTGRIEISGIADLGARALDQKVTVIPNLDATLPIAGTIAGGPVAGVAVLIAQRLMTRQVDEIYHFDYAVNGPWADPEVRLLDSSGTLSKLLNPFQQGAPADGGAAADGAPTDEVPRATPDATPPTAPTDATTTDPAPADDENAAARGGPGPLGGVLDLFRRSKRVDAGELPLSQ